MPPAHGVNSLCCEYSVLGQAPLESVESRGGPRGDADLRIEVLYVVVGRLWRDIELAGCFLGGTTSRNQPQDLDFARRQSRQASGRLPACGLAGAGEDGFDRVGAQLSLPHRGAQL